MDYPQSDQFYKREVFEMLTERLSRIEMKVDSTIEEIAQINARFSYIWGIVAGGVVIVNLVWLFIKEKILKI